MGIRWGSIHDGLPSSCRSLVLYHHGCCYGPFLIYLDVIYLYEMFILSLYTGTGDEAFYGTVLLDVEIDGLEELSVSEVESRRCTATTLLHRCSER